MGLSWDEIDAEAAIEDYYSGPLVPLGVGRDVEVMNLRTAASDALRDSNGMGQAERQHTGKATGGEGHRWSAPQTSHR